MNMRKLMSILLSVMIVVSLAACGDSSMSSLPPEKDNTPNPSPTQGYAKPSDDEAPDVEIEDDSTNTSDVTDPFNYTPLDNCEFAFIDCGQADSILIKAPEGNVLIDAGEDKDAEAVISALEERSVDVIDLLIATHAHSDHIGGMQTIVESYEIENIVMSPTGHTSKTYENLLLAIEKTGGSIDIAEPGNVYEFGDLKVKIIAPVKEYEDLNDSSVCVIATYGDTDVLLTGDAEAQAEADFIHNVYDVDVMKAGHHGSETSSSELLLDTANPEIVVISVGEGNKYNHPNDITLEHLDERNIKYFRTDKDGEVRVMTDGKMITVLSNNGGASLMSGQENTDESNNDTKNIVYMTESGSKYHSTKECGSLKNSKKIIEKTEEEAISMKYERCTKCYQ